MTSTKIEIAFGAGAYDPHPSGQSIDSALEGFFSEYWKFDTVPSSTLWADEKGHGKILVSHNTQTGLQEVLSAVKDSAVPSSDWAMLLGSGSSHRHLRLGFTDPVSDFSVHLFAKFDTLDGEQTIWELGDGTGGGPTAQLSLAEGHLKLTTTAFTTGDVFTTVCPRLLEANRWYQIVAVNEFNGDLSIYVNGRLEGSMPQDGQILAQNNDLFLVGVGCEPSTGAISKNPMRGRIQHLAFVTDPLAERLVQRVRAASVGDWTDVTADCFEDLIDIGRNNNIQTLASATGVVPINNEHGHYDPNNPEGPHYGYLKPMRHIRITKGGQRVFTGYVEAFPMSYVDWTDSRVTLKVLDALALLARFQLPENSLALEIEADSPSGWWRFSETGGEAVDISGNARNGLYVEDEQRIASVRGDIWQSSKAAFFNDDYTGQGVLFNQPPIRRVAPMTLEAYFTTSKDDPCCIFHQRDTGGTYPNASIELDDTGALVVGVNETASSGNFKGNTGNLYDGEAHQVAGVFWNEGRWLIVDGEAETVVTEGGFNIDESTDAKATFAAPCSFGIGPDYLEQYFEGILDEVAFFDGTLHPDRLAAHHAAAAGWAGDTTSERIKRLLKAAGIPSSLMRIQEGGKVLGGAVFPSDALSYLSKLVDGEQAICGVDRYGRIFFKVGDPVQPTLAAPAVTIGDRPDGGGLLYRQLDVTDQVPTITGDLTQTLQLTRGHNLGDSETLYFHCGTQTVAVSVTGTTLNVNSETFPLSGDSIEIQSRKDGTDLIHAVRFDGGPWSADVVDSTVSPASVVSGVHSTVDGETEQLALEHWSITNGVHTLGGDIAEILEHRWVPETRRAYDPNSLLVFNASSESLCHAESPAHAAFDYTTTKTNLWNLPTGVNVNADLTLVDVEEMLATETGDWAFEWVTNHSSVADGYWFNWWKDEANGQRSLRIGFIDGKVAIDGVALVPSVPVTANTWHHFLLSVSDNQATLYQNGSAVGTALFSAGEGLPESTLTIAGAPTLRLAALTGFSHSFSEAEAVERYGLFNGNPAVQGVFLGFGYDESGSSWATTGVASTYELVPEVTGLRTDTDQIYNAIRIEREDIDPVERVNKTKVQENGMSELYLDVELSDSDDVAALADSLLLAFQDRDTYCDRVTVRSFTDTEKAEMARLAVGDVVKVRRRTPYRTVITVEERIAGLTYVQNGEHGDNPPLDTTLLLGHK